MNSGSYYDTKKDELVGSKCYVDIERIIIKLCSFQILLLQVYIIENFSFDLYNFFLFIFNLYELIKFVI